MENKKKPQKSADMKPLHEDMATHTHDQKAVDKLIAEQEAMKKMIKKKV